MNQSLQILFPVLDTNSGKVMVAEKINQNQKTKYYAFQFQNQVIPKTYLIEYDNALKKSKHNELFRQYYEMHIETPGNPEIPYLHLFHYYEDGKFLDQKVIDYGKQRQSFNYAEIQLYLKNFLIALYELHSNQIPGRIFSIYNTLVVQERLVIMDFGFGPNINQDNLDILAPPEYLEQIINNKNYIQKEFDLKFDSWLLGAILYHLIKFKSINQVEVQGNSYQRFKYDRVEEYYNYLKNLDHIPCQTTRYKNDLLSFVESLLTCNKDNRLSFEQIHKHEYIQNLELENKAEYIKFYSENQFIKDCEIGITSTQGFQPATSQISFDLRNSFTQGHSESVIIKQEDHPSPQVTRKPIKITEQISNYQEDAQGYPNFLNIILNTPQFNNTNFNIYWLKIQLDCLKCQMLKQTAEKITTILPKYKHPYHQVLVYIIKKMNSIVLREMDSELKSAYFQKNLDEQWEDFLSQNKQNLPRSDSIISYSRSLQSEIAILYNNFETFLNEESTTLSNSVKKSIESDKSQNFNMLNNPQEFYQDIYREEFELLLQFINDKITSNNNLEELNQLKLLVFHCSQITTLFQLETFEETFKGLAQQNQKPQPKDLAQYFGINN